MSVLSDSVSEVEFNSLLNDVATSTCASKRYYDMWRILNGTDRPKYVDVLNDYLYFSKSLISSTFHMFIVTLYHTVDKKCSSNIYDLLDELKNSDKFESYKIDNYKDKMDLHAKTIKGVIILRNNAIAHVSKKISWRETFKKADVKPDGLSSFIDTLIYIVNDIYDNLGVSGRQIVGDSSSDLKRLLDDLIKLKKLTLNTNT